MTIERRFHGPPDSGNGGYVCGTVAGHIAGAAEVTLRRPPPLERPLAVERRFGGGVVLLDGETLIAEGVPTSVEIDVPEPVSFAEAEAAAQSYVGLQRHLFPSCFVCGPQRAEGDGLRLFPGRTSVRQVVAAPWTPDASLAAQDGTVRPEFLWAALDCPGAWALFQDIDEERAIILGRLAAKLIAPVRPREPHVAIGWPLGEDGRKLYSGTALFSAEGELRAFARATWIRMG